MLRHYCAILRQLVVRTLLSYTSMSVQSLVIQFKISHVPYLRNWARYYLWAPWKWDKLSKYVGADKNLSIKCALVGSLYNTKVPRQSLQYVIIEIIAFHLYHFHSCLQIQKKGRLCYWQPTIDFCLVRELLTVMGNYDCHWKHIKYMHRE